MANAILAAVLSFLVPGLGQIYAGDTKKWNIVFNNYHFFMDFKLLYNWNIWIDIKDCRPYLQYLHGL